MTPDLLLPTRRSFLGWTAALAGCALLTRPALAVPEPFRIIIKPRTKRVLLRTPDGPVVLTAPWEGSRWISWRDVIRQIPDDEAFA